MQLLPGQSMRPGAVVHLVFIVPWIMVAPCWALFVPGCCCAAAWACNMSFSGLSCRRRACPGQCTRGVSCSLGQRSGPAGCLGSSVMGSRQCGQGRGRRTGRVSVGSFRQTGGSTGRLVTAYCSSSGPCLVLWPDQPDYHRVDAVSGICCRACVDRRCGTRPGRRFRTEPGTGHGLWPLSHGCRPGRTSRALLFGTVWQIFGSAQAFLLDALIAAGSIVLLVAVQKERRLRVQRR